jgi:hypothetical protein
LLDDLFLNTINLEQRIRKAIQDVWDRYDAQLPWNR